MTKKDLTPAVRVAVEQKTITGEWNGRTLLKLLGELEGWDKMAEQRKEQGKRMVIGGFIASFLTFIFVVVSLVDGENRAIALAVFAAAIGLTVMGQRRKKSALAMDLPNELRVTVRPLLKHLSQDLHPEEKLRVALHLAGIDEAKGQAGKFTLRGEVSTWEEDVGTIRMPLADGTEAVLRMENSYTKLYRSYRNARGKQKSKTKWKKVATVTAILIPPVRIEWESGRGARMVDQANEKLTFAEKDGVMTARLARSYKFKVMGDRPENAAPAADVLRMFIRLTAMRPQAAGGVR